MKVTIWSVIEGLEEIVPPQPAKKYIPEWWKNVPAFVPNAGYEQQSKDQDKTIKQCPALFDWFQQGYVIPMWADLHVELRENGEVIIDSSDDVFGAPGIMKDDAYISWLPEQQKKHAVALFLISFPPNKYNNRLF